MQMSMRMRKCLSVIGSFQVVWLSRLQETQSKYKEAVKLSECAAASNNSNVGTSGVSATPLSEGKVIDHPPQTDGAFSTSTNDEQQLITSGVDTSGQPHRAGRLTSHCVIGTSTSFSSAFWSSTSSDRQSTTSSIQSIGAMSRGSISNGPPPVHRLTSPPSISKTAVSRTISAGPMNRSSMSGIVEESLDKPYGHSYGHRHLPTTCLPATADNKRVLASCGSSAIDGEACHVPRKCNRMSSYFRGFAVSNATTGLSKSCPSLVGLNCSNSLPPSAATPARHRAATCLRSDDKGQGGSVLDKKQL